MGWPKWASPCDISTYTGLQIRLHNEKIIFLISQPKHMFKLMDKKIITILKFP